MPQKKKPQLLYGIDKDILPALAKHLNGRCKDWLGLDEAKFLFRIAEHPEILSCFQKHKDIIERYGLLFAKHTDDVLEILTFIRKELAKMKSPDAPDAKIVRRELRTSSIYRDMEDGEIAVALQKKYSKRTVQTANVKAERQRIAKDDERNSIHSHPDFLLYRRTGEPTSLLKKLLKARGLMLPQR